MTTTTLTSEIAATIQAARREGYRGPASEYVLTALDCDAIVAALGRRPTPEEWADAGYRYVGSAHAHS